MSARQRSAGEAGHHTEEACTEKTEDDALSQDDQPHQGDRQDPADSGNAILEILRRQPSPLRDTESAEQGDVGRWPTEPGDADPPPLAADGQQRDGSRRSLDLPAHRSRISRASSSTARRQAAKAPIPAGVAR